MKIIKIISICILCAEGIFAMREPYGFFQEEKEPLYIQKKLAQLDKDTQLKWAVNDKNREKIITAVKSGAQVNVVNFDDNPLGFAFFTDDYELVKFLVQHGADIDLKLRGAYASERDYMNYLFSQGHLSSNIVKLFPVFQLSN